MDGAQFTYRSLRDAFCAGVCVAVFVGQQAHADLPLPLHVEGVAKPLVAFPPRERASATSDATPRAVTTRPAIVRSPVQILHVDAPAAAQPKPILVRPSPRVINGDRVPTYTLLSGTQQIGADAAITTLSYPAVQVATSTPKNRITVEEALETTGSVTFRKTPLSEVVFLLSELWHINIVAGENVSGEVSGAFYDAPLREVLSAALTASGYSYRKNGNSLIVLPIDQVGSDDPSFDSKMIRLPSSLRDDDSALRAAELLLSDRGRLQKIGENSVLVIDNAQRIARIQQLFTDLSPAAQTAISTTNPAGMAPATMQPAAQTEAIIQSGIAYFTPQFTEAEEMAEPLQAALGEDVVVAVYPEENRIMVKGNPDDLRLATQAIEQLDQPRTQVRITAMIYDVGLGELEKLGVNWTRELRASANASDEALGEVTQTIRDMFLFNADLTGSGAASLGITTLTDKFAAGAFLEALDNTTEAKLLADPSITVGDRRQASIRIVRKIPIIAANPVQNSNAVFTQTEFEEAGVILNVLPRISRDGTIELQVQPEYSVVAELLPTGPVIDSRTADTTVRVGNGQMFVLGGLRQKSIVESVRGIPYLKDIKHFGKFFRSHDSEVRESELIVFLRPEIVTPYAPGSPREQVAGNTASCQLDAIPYAEPVPVTPCCRDPYCPNHHPRPRINCGSRSLDMIGEQGFSAYEIYGAQDIQIVDDDGEESVVREQHEHVINDVTSNPLAESVEQVYPPVHIDPRVLTSEPR